MHRPLDEPADGAVPTVVRPRPAEPPGLRPGGPADLTGNLPDPARVDPAVLAVLLARHGWRRRGGAAGRYSRWTPPGPSAAAGG
ncbi:hypothetical protein G3I76_57985, partial [Streptomyces sp. SID11233]|nr:hypothetical protein [Streptomyces sp. SID11233]